MARQTFSIPLPLALPPCAHCVLRWEWIAVQDLALRPAVVEFYANCADVRIVSAAPAATLLPGPTTRIDGIAHLPHSVATATVDFRDAWGEWRAKELGHRFINRLGPALWPGAVPGGCIDTGTGAADLATCRNQSTARGQSGVATSGASGTAGRAALLPTLGLLLVHGLLLRLCPALLFE